MTIYIKLKEKFTSYKKNEKLNKVNAKKNKIITEKLLIKFLNKVLLCLL